jgi:threonine/homoserine/homoserine lactone efflux protein
VLAFNILKYAGAAWLLWLAFNSFRTGAAQQAADTAPPLSGWALYRRGIIMNVTNPKVSLFFLAFLPQFASAAAGSIRIQLVILGLLFIMATLLVFGSIALLAGTLGHKIAGSARAGIIMNRIAGTVFAALALRLFVVRQQ